MKPEGLLLILLLLTCCKSYQVKNDRHSQSFALNEVTNQAFFCWVDADKRHVYFREAIIPPGVEQITYKDIETVTTMTSTWKISSCGVGVTSDGYVSVVYDRNIGPTGISIRTKSRMINGSTWSAERTFTTLGGDDNFSQVTVLTVDDMLYAFSVSNSIFVVERIYVTNQSAPKVSAGKLTDPGPPLPHTLHVAHQDGIILVKWGVSNTFNAGVYRLYYDTDLNEVGYESDFFDYPNFYDPLTDGNVNYGPFPSPKEIDDNYLNLLGKDHDGAHFINTKYGVDDPNGEFPASVYGSTTLFKMQELQCTITTDIYEDDDTKYWIVALRNPDSHLSLMFYNLSTFVESTNFTDVTFYGTDDSSNAAFDMWIVEETKKMFFLFANVSGDVPILFETALCEEDNDCSCSHSCDEGYCRPADLSERCENELLPHCRYQDEECYGCLDDSHCENDLICDQTTFSCEECVSDDNCSVPTPACSLNQECVGCINDDYCEGEMVCDSSSNVCVECLSDENCEGEMVCNTTSNICVECSVDGECLNDQLSVCFEQQCVECVESGDCQENEDALQCLDSKHICVECFDDSHCTVGGEVCDEGTNQCSQGCSQDGDCENSSLSHCFNSEICVECLLDEDCDVQNDQVCSEIHQCVNCVNSDDCGDGLYCNVNNECVGCLNNSHCDGDQICDVVCVDPTPTETETTESTDDDKISNDASYGIIPLQIVFLLWLVI